MASERGMKNSHKPNTEDEGVVKKLCDTMEYFPEKNI